MTDAAVPALQPRVFRGALVVLNDNNQPARVIAFQYNPDSLTRKLEARTSGGGGQAERLDAFRLAGPPRETITLSIEIDAVDQLAAADRLTIANGLYPSLTQLELLLYPTSQSVQQNADQATQGSIEIVPPEAPLTLFVWGQNRVVPVRIGNFTITEQAYDTTLNPIRAKVDLELHVLSTIDLVADSPGYNIFMAYHKGLEALAGLQSSNSLQPTGVTTAALQR